MSVFSSLRYCLQDDYSRGNIYAALAFLPFGLFFDFMDGKVARWRKKSSMMGQELDSLADLVCFFSGAYTMSTIYLPSQPPLPHPSPLPKLHHASMNLAADRLLLPSHRSPSASPRPWSPSRSACARRWTTCAWPSSCCAA